MFRVPCSVFRVRRFEEFGKFKEFESLKGSAFRVPCKRFEEFKSLKGSELRLKIKLKEDNLTSSKTCQR